jgi:hypothetical protein
MQTLLSERINYLSESEITELEKYTEFLLFRRSFKNNKSIYDDIPTKEITKLISLSEGFNWLDTPEEDVYSQNDGVPPQW